MYNINLITGGHDWEKQNLMTIAGKNKNHDILKCRKCGIKGRTSSLVSISLKGSYKEEKVMNCTGETPIPLKIKIRKCAGFGDYFDNLTPDSEHDVIVAPAGYSNSVNGVWVMGVGQPVMVLREEYEPIL